MKSFLKIFLKHYLRIITKAVLFFHRPTVIAVSGSINKNFVKKEIKSRLLKNNLKVRANPKNFNTEIGLPLAILNLPSGYNEYKKWIPTIVEAPLKVFQKNFPDFLVLSLGTSDEGDMKYLLSIVKPDIAIITDITQRYREGFSDMNNLVKEYKILTKKTKKEGLLIINSDNYRVKSLGKKSKQRTIYFGFNDNADFQIVKSKRNKLGQSVKIKNGEKESTLNINKFGKHHAYAFVIGQIVENELKNTLKIDKK